jgi:hypothetical protein
MNTTAALPWYGWVGLVLLLGGQGTWLFLDARRRGARAWFWGTWGLIQFPMPSLFYWLFVVRRIGRKRA